MHLPRNLAKSFLYLSLPLIFLFLILVRPPLTFYVLPLAPIALAAMLYEVGGGTLVALAAMAGVGVLIALEPDAARRATTLRETWPILSMYLIIGPVVGWLTGREHDRERRLVSAARRLHVVQEVTEAINTSLDLEQTLQTIIAETQRLAPFERAAVLLQEDAALRVMAVDDNRRQSQLVGQTFSLQETATGWVMARCRTWTGKPSDINQYPDTRTLCPPDGSCLIIPLTLQRRAIGVFLLGGRGLSKLIQADVDNLTQIAGQMAIAIEHARLFEAERRWSSQMIAIGEACREIAASLNLKRTLKLVMAKGVETLPMDAGALFMLDPETQTYQAVVSHNLSQGHVDQITFAFEEGVPGWAAKHRQTLIIPKAATDERVHPHIVQEEIQSVLATPLVARERVVGVLNLYCKTQENAFNDDAVRLAEVFAAQAAIAIENARLVEELRQAAAELEARVERRTQQLRETQAQIMRTEKMAVVGRLAASVAHEVNNPLQAIDLQLQLIADEERPEPANRRLTIVQEELTRIADIVQRLLDFQRPSLEKRVPQDISLLLDDVLALADKQLHQHDIIINRQEQPNLAPVLVAGNQMKQVFLNLVLNAIEAMPGGGRLQVCTQQKNGMIVVAFTDTGIGLSPQVMDNLFEPFYSTKAKGTGLGLAVSHEIVCQHDGRLEAQNEPPEQGATFTVRLPAHRQEQVGV